MLFRSVKALRYTTEHGYTRTESQEEVDEYQAMRHLIRLLDPQPVKKEGYMVVYSDETRSHLFDYQYDAEQWARNAPNSRVVKVTWEE